MLAEGWCFITPLSGDGLIWMEHWLGFSLQSCHCQKPPKCCLVCVFCSLGRSLGWHGALSSSFTCMISAGPPRNPAGQFTMLPFYRWGEQSSPSPTSALGTPPMYSHHPLPISYAALINVLLWLSVASPAQVRASREQGLRVTGAGLHPQWLAQGLTQSECSRNTFWIERMEGQLDDRDDRRISRWRNEWMMSRLP